jgi:hypothetical protein
MSLPSTPPAPSATELFGVLWESMADILGTAATATLLRRAARRAASPEAGLSALTIGQQGLTYRYVLPDTWTEPQYALALGELKALTAELEPLLTEMTGPVVLRRLARVPALGTLGIAPHAEEVPQ